MVCILYRLCKVTGRSCLVENEEHCDFVKLREAVLRTNVDALRERTHNVLYEAYRRERLRAMKVGDGDTGPKMMEAFAQVFFLFCECLKIFFISEPKLFKKK